MGVHSFDKLGAKMGVHSFFWQRVRAVRHTKNMGAINGLQISIPKEHAQITFLSPIDCFLSEIPVYFRPICPG